MSTGCWVFTDSVTKLTREVDRLGSTAARLKLKGIDGDPHKRWMMWFNSMQREKPYLPLTCLESCRDVRVLEREPGHRCCMAVVSSCHELLRKGTLMRLPVTNRRKVGMTSGPHGPYG